MDVIGQFGSYTLKELVNHRDAVKATLRRKEEAYRNDIAASKSVLSAVQALITIRELEGKNNS